MNINNKQVNKAISSLLDLPNLYDVRRELRIVQPSVTREEAEEYLDRYTDKGMAYNTWEYTITSSQPVDYCSNIEDALYAARRIAERNQYTYVLSFEDGEWRGAFGSYGDCAEHKGSNPALVTCCSILKFMGKL